MERRKINNLKLSLSFVMLILAQSSITLAMSIMDSDENISINPRSFSLERDSDITIDNYRLTRYSSSGKDKIQFSSLGESKVFELDNIKNKTIKIDDNYFKIYGFEKNELKIGCSILENEKYQNIKISTSVPDYIVFDSMSEVIILIRVKNNGAFEEIFELGAEMGLEGCISHEFTYSGFRVKKIKLTKGQEEDLELRIQTSTVCKNGDNNLKAIISIGNYSKSLTKIVTISDGSELKSNKLVIQFSKLFINGKAGEAIELSAKISNMGNNDLNQIKFQVANKKDGWKYEFEPKEIENIKSKEYSTIKVKITPSVKTEIGDSFVDIKAKAGVVESENVKLRINVKGDSGSSWIGIVIAILVVVGLIIFFRKVGRR